MRHQILNCISQISPFDELEREHLAFAARWIESGAEIFRTAKPAIPDPHLVAYFLVIDPVAEQVLLVDHKKSGLWLPTGGHVELNEHPLDTVKREAIEELGVAADFLAEEPLFLTMAKTVGKTAGHTDISLWYALKGDVSACYTYDCDEFNQIRWFSFAHIPYGQSDPHLGRYMAKLANFIALQPNCAQSIDGK